MSDEDAALLSEIQRRTHLSMAALARLIFHRGLQAYLTDGKLEG